MFTLFTRLMALNQEAFDIGWFDVAYHALAGALHAAQQEPDHERGAEELSQVETTAITQAAWLDEHAPEYPHSTVSTKRRHPSNESIGIYTMLAHQSHAHQVILNRRKGEDA